METKRKDTLTLLLIIVIVIILGIIGYLGFEVISGNVKETQSNEITDEFEKQIPTLTEEEIQEIRARAAKEVEEQIANGEISIGSLHLGQAGEADRRQRPGLARRLRRPHRKTRLHQGPRLHGHLDHPGGAERLGHRLSRLSRHGPLVGRPPL